MFNIIHWFEFVANSLLGAGRQVAMKNADAYANEEMKRAAHIVKEQKKTDGQFDIYC